MPMGPVYRLDTRLWLPRPRLDVFEFFADAGNLQRITPPFVAFRMLTPAPLAMRAGALIDYRIGLRGLPMTWRSEITVWEPPHRFVDVQRKGPYGWWEHTHTFEEQAGGTLVVDTVRYALRGPVFLAGAINRLIVAPDLRRIFSFRHEALQDAFGVRGEAKTGEVKMSREPGP
jgi:ligand-binding SRPBCC domain-containing protein